MTGDSGVCMNRQKDKPAVLVSACLLGFPCRYDGKSKLNEEVAAMSEKYELVPVCPECLGGLPTPRSPSELKDGRAITSDGEDRTEQFVNGANETLKIALKRGCLVAVMKERSPSCGSGIIHNGRFDEGLTEGWGVAAALLRSSGIWVLGESSISKLKKDH